MKEGIEVMPQPIVSLGNIDVDSQVHALRTMNDHHGKMKKKLSFHKQNTSAQRKHRTLTNAVTIDGASLVSRKISMGGDSEGDRLSRQDSDDNKSIKSRKSISVYSSVNKSIRATAKKMNATISG